MCLDFAWFPCIPSWLQATCTYVPWTNFVLWWFFVIVFHKMGLHSQHTFVKNLPNKLRKWCLWTVASLGQFDAFLWFFTKWGSCLCNKNHFSDYSQIPMAALMQGLQLICIHLPTQKNLFLTHVHSIQILRKNFNL